MSNFFLLNEAIELADFDAFKSGMLELNVIDRSDVDVFMKHASVYYLSNYDILCNTSGPDEQVIIQFIEQLSGYKHYLPNKETFDAHFAAAKNAFLGIDFSTTVVASTCRIKNDASYKIFKNEALWDVTFRNLWAKRSELFPNLILCGQVENQIRNVGNSAHFNQILTRLVSFNEAVSEWKNGDFSYRQINQNYSLRISPESKQTMNNHESERRFRMPNGGTKTFELHIKTGDLRFHFYPDNASLKVYIGYIGPHLTVSSD